MRMDSMNLRAMKGGTTKLAMTMKKLTNSERNEVTLGCVSSLIAGVWREFAGFVLFERKGNGYRSVVIRFGSFGSAGGVEILH
jgi:hypothetical protein